MYKTKIFFFIIIVLTLNLFSQQIPRGVVKEGLKIDSRILNQEVRYTIYLPFDYETSDRYYPVVYLLHGYTDNDMAWIQFGEANIIADEAIGRREIPSMIIVMPDGGVTWFINNFDETLRYEDFFFDEFIPYIESRYRIRNERRYRGIAGLSMGGFGTLVYAFKHPDLFTSCVSFSTSIRTEEEIINMNEIRWKERFEIIYGPGLVSDARITEHYLRNNPINILKTQNPEKIKNLRIYIDCGDDDHLYKGNSTLHILMRDLGIDHEFRIRDGGHQWSYWRSGLKEALKFIGTSFHQP